MAWYIAPALEVLRAEINQKAPNRSKSADGGIGDAAHSSRLSDHNPDSRGCVNARDFTHDPVGGLDCHQLFRHLIATRDRRIKYLIWNRMIVSSEVQPWKIRNYSGVNPHTRHLHVSVVGGRSHDIQSWGWYVPPPPPTEQEHAENGMDIIFIADPKGTGSGIYVANTARQRSRWISHPDTVGVILKGKNATDEGHRGAAYGNLLLATYPLED